MSKANGKTGNKASDTKINKLVAQYNAVKSKIEEIELIHQRQLEPFKTVKQQLVGVMLEFLDRSGQESARTDEGTVTATMRFTAALDDPGAFMNYVMENGAYELMEQRASSTSCREFAEEHGDLPPGVRLNSIRGIRVTKRS